MTGANFYLICFAVGFAFSLLSFLAGSMRWHLHLPHFSHGHMGSHVSPAGAAAHAPANGPGGGKAHAHVAHLSPFNFVSFTAFFAWFGGTGYLLTRYSSLWFLAALGIAGAVGLAGAAIIFLFLGRVLMSREENLDPADFDMVGMLGRTSVPIREGGTGEIIYSQAGTRRTCGARSEIGAAIAKSSEVVVTRYEKGIAYVRLWEELAQEESATALPQTETGGEQ
jgi:membrane protein implicated in regulation of membrane protease activity